MNGSNIRSGLSVDVAANGTVLNVCNRGVAVNGCPLTDEFKFRVSGAVGDQTGEAVYLVISIRKA